MPMIPFQPNTRIRSADVNANFTNSLALDTPRTVIVTHTWTARQLFSGGITVSGASTFGGDVDVNGAFRVTGGIAATGTVSAPRFRATDDGSDNSVAYGDAAGNDGMFFSGGAPTFVRNGVVKFQIQQNALVASGGAVFTGDGSGLTDLPAGNLVGTVAGGVHVPAGTLTGNIASARLSGAYTGITRVGTLTQLNVNGSSVFGGGGSPISWIRSITATIDSFTESGTTWSALVNMPGVQEGDFILIDNPFLIAPFVATRQWATSAHVNAANVVRVRVTGTDGPGPGPRTVRLVAIRLA